MTNIKKLFTKNIILFYISQTLLVPSLIILFGLLLSGGIYRFLNSSSNNNLTISFNSNYSQSKNSVPVYNLSPTSVIKIIGSRTK